LDTPSSSSPSPSSSHGRPPRDVSGKPPFIDRSTALGMFARAVELVTQTVEETRFVHSSSASSSSASLINTKILRTLDTRAASQARDGSAAVMAQ
jgi:hypothetical protein